MAWTKNFDIGQEFEDSKGVFGGFVRDPEGDLGTGTGPLISANGTVWYIIVDNTGNVKTTTATP